MKKNNIKEAFNKKNHHILFQIGVLIFVLFAVLITLNVVFYYFGTRVQAAEGEYENAYSVSQRLGEMAGQNQDNPEYVEYVFNEAYDNIKVTLKGPVLAYYDDEDCLKIEVNPDESLPFNPGDELVIVDAQNLVLYQADVEDLDVAKNNLVSIYKQGYMLDAYTAVAYPVVVDDDFVGLVVTVIDVYALTIKDFGTVNRISIINSVIAFLLGNLLLMAVYFSVIKPLTAVVKGIKNYTNDMDTDKLVSDMNGIRSRNEIGRLATDISDMGERIKKYSEENTEMVRKQTRISSELDLAANIQKAVLPVNFPKPEEETRYKLYASMNPAKEVGGDFYDFFMTDENHIALVIADVSDKGIPAALFMMNAKSLIQSHVMGGDSPAEALGKINKMLCENNKAFMFVTVWLAVIDVSTGKGLFANAGHEDPVFYSRSEGKWERLKTKHSPALAVVKKTVFTEHEITLNPGDAIFVYTDGVTDAKSKEEGFFGADRLLGLLNGSPDDEPDEMIQTVSSELLRFSAENDQFDDTTMLCFKIGM